MSSHRNCRRCCMPVIGSLTPRGADLPRLVFVRAVEARPGVLRGWASRSTAVASFNTSWSDMRNPRASSAICILILAETIACGGAPSAASGKPDSGTPDSAPAMACAFDCVKWVQRQTSIRCFRREADDVRERNLRQLRMRRRVRPRRGSWCCVGDYSVSLVSSVSACKTGSIQPCRTGVGSQGQPSSSPLCQHA
jgi:hypothetical protein